MPNPVHDFPCVYNRWGGTFDGRCDLVVGFASMVGAMQAAKATNPSLVALMSPSSQGAFPFPTATYGGSTSIELFGGATDAIVDGAGLNVGTIRAFDSYWDFIRRADGTQAPCNPPSATHPGYDLGAPSAGDPGHPLSQPVPDFVAKYIAWRAKTNRLYRDNWDGIEGDNGLYRIGADYFYGSIPTLDLDRNGVVDTTHNLRSNWAGGLDRVGSLLRTYLPGKIIGWNGNWNVNAFEGDFPDPDGWKKSTNHSLLEDGESYIRSASNVLRYLTYAGAFLAYPDTGGDTRYFAFQISNPLDVNGAQLPFLADSVANSDTNRLGTDQQRNMRAGLALAVCGGAHFRIKQGNDECRWYYKDEYLGGALNTRQWAGKAVAAYTNPLSGIFMRELQRGLFIANVGGSAQTVSVPGGAGTWQQITGVENRGLNNGAAVGATVNVPAYDGVILVRIGAIPPVTSPPANLSVPTLSGNATSGQVLTPAPGVWSGSPTGYTMAFVRYAADGVTRTGYLTGPFAAPVSGPYTAYTYTIQSGDVGQTIRLEVTATNGTGTSAAVLSTPTPVIGAGNTVPVSATVFNGPYSDAFDFATAQAAPGVIQTVVFPWSGPSDFTPSFTGAPTFGSRSLGYVRRAHRRRWPPT